MIVLTLTLFILTILSFFTNNRKFTAPSFLYSISFLFASFFALLNEKNWMLNLNHTTFWIIVLSVLEFIIVCLLVKWIIKIIENSYMKEKDVGISIFNFSKGKKQFIAIEIVQFLFIILSALIIMKVTGQSNLASAVNTLNYSNNGFTSVDISLPTYVSLMLNFNQYIGIVGEYLFAESLILKRNFNICLFIEVLLTLASSLLTGARGGSLMSLVSIIIFLFMFIYKDKRYNSLRIGKYVLIVTTLIIVVLFLLQWSASFVGRNVESFKGFEYISIYVGAEIKNLDTFITTNAFPIHGQVFGEQTFYSIINFAIKHLGLNLADYKLALPYQYINGISLGNVYTTLYPWLYDFGFNGVGVLTALMAIISEIFYSISERNTIKIAPISRLFYGGIIAPTIVFSFFSNKFYEAFDVITLCIALIIWCWFNAVFDKYKQKIN